MVLKSDLDFKTPPWPSVSEQAKDCVRQLLDRNVSKRITAAQVLQHPWLTQQGLQSDKPLDNVVIERMRQVRPVLHGMQAGAAQCVSWSKCGLWHLTKLSYLESISKTVEEGKQIRSDMHSHMI